VGRQGGSGGGSMATAAAAAARDHRGDGVRSAVLVEASRWPSEKEKKELQKCSNVYTFFTSTLKEITA